MTCARPDRLALQPPDVQQPSSIAFGGDADGCGGTAAHPVMAIMSSKLEAATTVAGRSATRSTVRGWRLSMYTASHAGQVVDRHESRKICAAHS